VKAREKLQRGYGSGGMSKQVYVCLSFVLKTFANCFKGSIDFKEQVSEDVRS